MNNLIGQQMETLYNLARGAKKIDVEEEAMLCEKCGEPTHSKLIGDEWFNYCENCQWASGENVNDNFTP